MEDTKKSEGTEGMEESKLPVISSAKDIFEKVDTGELVKALENRVTGAWAYEFPMDGKPVKGLSAPGVDEACLFIAQQSQGQTVIRTIPGTLKVTEEPDNFSAEVMAGVYVLGFIKDKPAELMLSTHIGYSKQVKRGVRKDKSTYGIPHAEVLAVRKAERNAKAHAIPDRIKEKIMAMALKKGKVVASDPDSPEESEQSGNGKEQEKKSNGKKDWNLFWMTVKNKGWTQPQAHEKAKELFKIGDSLTELLVEQFDELIEFIRQNPKEKSK
jgi:hypothetical protein